MTGPRREGGGAERAPAGEPEGFFERNADRIFYALAAVCAGLVLADLLYHKHVHFGFEEWFGFYGFFGFFSFLFIVLAGKELRKVLMRGEDYYEKDHDDGEEADA